MNERQVRAARNAYAWVYPIVFALALVVFGGGVYLAATGRGFTVLAAGAACVVGVLVAWPLALIVLHSRHCATDDLQAAIAPMMERFEQFSVMLNTISDNQLLSDRGKAIAYRTKDAEAIRRAIAEDIAKGDYEAAYQLANDMATQFGYRQEADRIRYQIDDRLQENARRRIAEHVAVIDRFTRAEQWPQAQQEANRLLGMYPDNEQVRKIPAEIENRRNQQKQQLLDSWAMAVDRKDVDGSIEILKRLDAYLTPQEGEQLQESARNIFRMRLDNLRTRFSTAVHGQNWTEAIRLGDDIANEFPNTTMAREVRETMPTLRQRANDAAAAAVALGA